MLTVNVGIGAGALQVPCSDTFPLTCESALIVTERVLVAVFDAESVTMTIKLAVPVVGEDPDNTPPLDKLSPIAVSWLLFAVTVQLYPPPEPPEAARESEYATPTLPPGSGLVLVTVRAALIVTDKVAVAVLLAESTTLAVKVAVPATGVAPESTPPLDRLSPTAVRLLPPEVTDQVSPVPVPPEVVNASEYATPAVPAGSGLKEVITSPALMVTLSVAVVELLAESTTLAVNVAVPETGVVPDKTPVPDRLSPTAVKLLAPEVTLHVRPVPVPPAAVSVSLYAVPA
jgi:hypothetical protein